MMYRTTTHELRRFLDQYKKFLFKEPEKIDISCYKPGRQTLCRIEIQSGEGFIDLTPYMTTGELYRFIENLIKLQRMNVLRC